MRRPERPESLVHDLSMSGLLLVALLALLGGYSDLLRGGDWWVSSGLVVALTLAACAAARGFGLRFAWLAGAVVFLLAMLVTFVPGSLAAGVLPTGSTVPAIQDTLARAQRVIAEQQAPVPPSRSVVFVVAGAFGLIALALDHVLVRLRWVMWTGVVLVAVYASPTVIAGTAPPLLPFLGAAAVWLAMLRLDTQWRAGGGSLGATAAPAVGVGVASLAVAVVLPSVLPQASAAANFGNAPPGGIFSSGVNPLLDLGQNLRRGAPVTSLTYTTTADEAQYLRIATIRDFTGRRWGPIQQSASFGPPESELAGPDVDVEDVSTRIAVERLNASQLPVPYAAVGLEGEEGAWTQQRQGLTYTSATADSRDQTYTVESVDVRPTAAQVRAAGSASGLSGMTPYLSTPAMPPVIAETADEVTSGETNDYDRAVALQDWLRTSGGFRYSVDTPVEDGYDGTGVRVVARFLEEKSGYCIHFASTMALMARTLDIPSRIAVGFAPGDSTGVDDDGDTIYENTSENLHAWPELYFDGIGWLRFEPTTGIGAATDLDAPQAGANADGATSGTASTPPPSSNGQDRGADGATTSTVADDTATAPRTLAVTLGVLLVIGALPWLVRTARRAWRLRRLGSSLDPAWREVEDTAVDLGIDVGGTRTPRMLLERLADVPGVSQEALDGVAQAVERERYARPDGTRTPVRRDLHSVLTTLRASSTRGARIRAALLPRSLVRRRPATSSTSQAVTVDVV